MNDGSAQKADTSPSGEHYAGFLPTVFGLCQQFKSFTVHSVFLSCHTGDNCIITSGSDVVVIRNILKQQNNFYLVCQKFCRYTDFFAYPLPSSQLGIYCVFDLSEEMVVCSLSDFKEKNVMMPFNDSFVVVPLKNIQV